MWVSEARMKALEGRMDRLEAVKPIPDNNDSVYLLTPERDDSIFASQKQDHLPPVDGEEVPA